MSASKKPSTGYPAAKAMTSHLPPGLALPETEPCSPFVYRVVAPNANELTYTGTNSFIVHAPHASSSSLASRGALIVDPGPDIPCHLDALMNRCRELGCQPLALFATHTHDDHADGIPPLAARYDLPVLKQEDGSVGPGPLSVDGLDLELEVIPLPGHSADSVGLLIAEDRSLLSGDMIFSHGSSVIVHPDGSLAAYLESLDRLEALVEEGRVSTLIPAHGFVIDDPLPLIRSYRAHRLERIEQTRDAIAQVGADEPGGLLAFIYPGLAPSLRGAAERTVAAQLAYLAELGEISLPEWVRRLDLGEKDQD